MAINTTLAGRPALQGPLAGIISLFTASFYKLNPAGTNAIEPIADLVPSVTPNRVALDMIDAENYAENYTVTQNVLQDFTNTTPNVHRELIQLQITGTFSAVGPLLPIGQVPTFGFRFDLYRLNQLRAMAEARKPIMVITPRVSLPAAFFTSIQTNWNPAEGESIPMTVTLMEARLVGPNTVAALADTVNMEAGNVQTTSGGTQGGTATNPSTATEPPVAEVPPVYDATGTVGP